MKKAERIEEFVASLHSCLAQSRYPECYRGYFLCFNQQLYYEAHDVLEHLWLEEKNADSDFYQGLIQLAGAFVHLQKHYHQPEHPTHSRRLAPAARLFALARQRLSPYPEHHLGLNLSTIRQLIDHYIQALEKSHFTKNPWSPATAPQLDLR
jgi:predicted metal-dependent hydrolase